MSSDQDWEEFKHYWDHTIPRNGAIGGAVGGAVGGFIVAIIVGLFIWCCLKKHEKYRDQEPVQVYSERRLE